MVFGSSNSKSALSGTGLPLCLAPEIKTQKLPVLGCWLYQLEIADYTDPASALALGL